MYIVFFFFFQAEDGIRDKLVTGVQTCALPILDRVVKVEGKRISLPELEHSLRQHPWVTDAAIVPLSGGKEALGAVVVLREPGRAGEIRDRLIPDLRKYLLQRFERVLVPRHWRFLERMPVDER